jgi:methenyltetrahydrofolate cyclohydrolase
VSDTPPTVSVNDLLDALRAPGNGVAAGCAAAAVAAVAAGIVQGVARESGEVWDEAGGVAAQAEALADRLAGLADRNARTHGAARRALAGHVRGDSQPARDHLLGRALDEAALVPGRVAAVAADVAELAEGSAGRLRDDLRPDALAAAVLAAAAADVAARLVLLNLAQGPDGALADAARAATRRARAAADRAAPVT